METTMTNEEMVAAMLAEQAARAKESKEKAKEASIKQRSKTATATGQGGALYFQGQEVPGGDEVFVKVGKESGQAVDAATIDAVRSRSGDTVRPDRSKRLDRLVRHPLTGKLVDPSELPI